MDDLNTRLDNYAVTCDARAAACRREAAAVRAEPATGWDDHERARGAEAKRQDAMAARWDTRAKYAREGKLTVHQDAEGIGHQREYSDLHAHAAAEHRAVQLDDDDRPRSE